MRVYLCGPINGCTDEECKVWRNEARRVLVDVVDPMRRDYRGREHLCFREIVEGDKEDIRKCDAMLVNHPKPSVGTSMEVYFAWMLGLPIVVVVPQGDAVSPWMRYHATLIVHSFSHAYDYLKEPCE